MLAVLPTSIESPMPSREPQKPSEIASKLKERKTLPEESPMAFMSPISRVRS